MDNRGEVSIQHYTSGVWNKEYEPISYCIIVTEMVTVMYRMLGLKHLVLSPKILVDARCESINDAKDIITNPNLGLQSIRDNPFVFVRSLQEKFEYQQGLRYWIDDLITHEGQSTIRRVLQQTYSENGKGKPLIANVRMGEFRQSGVALAAFDRPFRHKMDNFEEEYLEGLLIVGANFKGKRRDHYCVVMGSYGEEWGKKGFSKIALDMVVKLSEPVMLNKNISRVGWKEKRTWAEGKITVSKDKKRRVSERD